MQKQVEKRLSNNEDKKQFYRYLNGKTKSRAGIGPIKKDGKTLVEDGLMAEALNEYFASVFQEEARGQGPKATPSKVRVSCSWVQFRPGLVKENIWKLKKNSAPGPDGILPNLLQKLVDQVAEPLSMIYQRSMKKGVALAGWKSANLAPIHKKGSKRILVTTARFC